jgi:hypothetical protein
MKNQAQIEKKTKTKSRAAQQHRAKPSSAAKTIRVKLMVDNRLVALIDRGAKACGTSRSGFIRQAIEDINGMISG